MFDVLVSLIPRLFFSGFSDLYPSIKSDVSVACNNLTKATKCSGRECSLKRAYSVSVSYLSQSLTAFYFWLFNVISYSLRHWFLPAGLRASACVCIPWDSLQRSTVQNTRGSQTQPTAQSKVHRFILLLYKWNTL